MNASSDHIIRILISKIERVSVEPEFYSMMLLYKIFKRIMPKPQCVSYTYDSTPVASRSYPFPYMKVSNMQIDRSVNVQ